MTHIYTLTSRVAVANVGLHSLCVKWSWPQRTPVMCDNSSRHVWHISGDGPHNLLTLDQNDRLCSWVSTWHHIWGQVELRICCLVWQRGHACLPPPKGLNRWHFLWGTWKLFRPRTFDLSQVSMAWSCQSHELPPHCKCLGLFKCNKTQWICTGEWTLERLQTAVYINLSQN